MRDRAAIELFEPNELREWVALAERSGRDEFDRQTWALFDSARRFLRNPRMVERQTDEWLTRADCYELARLDLRCARIFLEGDGAMLLEALEHLVSAERYRALARDKWPAVKDHPRERVEVFDHPRYDPDAAKAAAKAARAKQTELEVSGLVPFEAFGNTYMLTPAEVERARAMLEASAERRVRCARDRGPLTAEERDRWQALVDVERMRRGLPMEGDDDEAIGVRFEGDGRLAPRSMTPSSGEGAYEDTLEQLGMRRDERGRWWITPPRETV